MMESLQAAVVVFSLLSLGQTAPVISCENMTQSIQVHERDKMLGRWNFVAMASAGQLFSPPSNWVDVKAITPNDEVITTQHPKMSGICHIINNNITVINNTLFSERPFSYRASLLPTSCPDCMLLYVQYTGRLSHRSLELLSRRTAVKDEEVEDFKKQAECLNFGVVQLKDPNTEFCKGKEGNL
ncbi:uncharacterized protein LOC103468904 [Poecilia reticulata]|uniref:uncharacterized protein LOC103468904 n=1 Tax=Poecilia reticulata TaxID=8081 RepID=UPI0004A4DB67|nr:PREDICTED: uncharacterized protein LOC103468904 [Poecilia reticulata]